MGLLKNLAEKGMDTWDDKKEDIINDMFDEESKEKMVNALNEAFSVSLASSTTNYFLLEIEPGTSDIVYGATITLERV